MCIAMQNYIYNFPTPQMQIYIPQKNINGQKPTTYQHNINIPRKYPLNKYPVLTVNMYIRCQK